MGKLIEWQIGQGIDALVICGTSGEAATFSREERVAASPLVPQITDVYKRQIYCGVTRMHLR